MLVQVPVAGMMEAGGGNVRDGNDDDNGIKYMAKRINAAIECHTMVYCALFHPYRTISE